MNIKFLKYMGVSVLALSVYTQHAHATNCHVSKESCEEEFNETSALSHKSLTTTVFPESSNVEEKLQEPTSEESIGKICHSVGQNFVSREIEVLKKEIDQEMNGSKEESLCAINKIKSKHAETLETIASSVFDRLETAKQPLKSMLESFNASSKEWDNLENIFSTLGSELLAAVNQKKEEHSL